MKTLSKLFEHERDKVCDAFFKGKQTKSNFQLKMLLIISSFLAVMLVLFGVGLAVLFSLFLISLLSNLFYLFVHVVGVLKWKMLYCLLVFRFGRVIGTLETSKDFITLNSTFRVLLLWVFLYQRFNFH